jgi:hypothetical protein
MEHRRRADESDPIQHAQKNDDLMPVLARKLVGDAFHSVKENRTAKIIR